MEKYDREFLIPYLQDICALYLADRVAAEKLLETRERVLRLKPGREIAPPEEPKSDTVSVLLAGLGMFLLVGSPLAWLIPGRNGMSGIEMGFQVFVTAACLPLGWFFWKSYANPARQAVKSNWARKTKCRKKPGQKDGKTENEAAEISRLEEKMAFYTQERKKIERLLEKAYSANVLPIQYRDIYAAVYLYDHFGNSRSDDLDMALNTYVLEQIKDKLDGIIKNQYTEILNQRLILANQQKSLEEQRVHNAYMRQRISQIASSTEEQTQYMAMAESHTAATAYFAAAGYLRQ